MHSAQDKGHSVRILWFFGTAGLHAMHHALCSSHYHFRPQRDCSDFDFEDSDDGTRFRTATGTKLCP